MIGERIRERRKDLQLTQEELSKKLSVSRQCISHWENEINEPGVNDIIRLAKILNTSTDYLLGETNIKHRYFLDKNLEHFINGCIKLYYENIKRKK